MYPSKTDGLFGVFVKNFKKELENQGVVFTVTSLIKGKAHYPFTKVSRYIFHYLSIVKNFFFGIYDFIYVHYLTHHLPILLLLIPFKTKPWVINTHGNDIIDLEHTPLLKKFSQVVLKKTDLIVVPTSYFKGKVLEYYPFIESDKIFISPSGGIDTSIFYHKKEKGNRQMLHLGFVSRFIEEKGWKTFLEALNYLRENNIPFKATIAGKGPDEIKIKAYIKAHKLTQINFIGFVNQKELVNLYNLFDLYIFPTYRTSESLGLTGVEAMSCGTPVIACNMAGPSTYIIDGENGFLIEPKNAEMLFKKIKSYYQLSEKEKIRFSEKALLSSKPFDKTIVAKKLISVLNNL